MVKAVKENKFLILAIWFCIVAVVQFSLAFWGEDQNFIIRMLGGILFSAGVFLAWREWKKQKRKEV